MLALLSAKPPLVSFLGLSALRSSCLGEISRAVSERWRRGEVSNKLRSRGADVCQNGRPHWCDSRYPRAVGSEKLHGSCRRFGGEQKSCKESGARLCADAVSARLFQTFSSFYLPTTKGCPCLLFLFWIKIPFGCVYKNFKNYLYIHDKKETKVI